LSCAVILLGFAIMLPRFVVAMSFGTPFACPNMKIILPDTEPILNLPSDEQ